MKTFYLSPKSTINLKEEKTPKIEKRVKKERKELKLESADDEIANILKELEGIGGLLHGGMSGRQQRANIHDSLVELGAKKAKGPKLPFKTLMERKKQQKEKKQRLLKKKSEQGRENMVRLPKKSK